MSESYLLSDPIETDVAVAAAAVNVAVVRGGVITAGDGHRLTD